MPDPENLDYLQSGFDPSTLTMPQLRSIFVAQAIPYPASAKKPHLIELFNEQVVPQSRRILASTSPAKRSSKGITDVESSQESPVPDDEELMSPPPTLRPRSTRKTSAKVKVEDSEPETSRARSPTKRTQRASSKHARLSDTETGIDAGRVKKSMRKSRSETPQIKAEENNDALPKASLEDCVFTDDNPFQSGSSPLSGVSGMSSGRRQTIGRTSTKDPNRKRSLPTARRHTESPKVDDGIRPPTSKTFEISVHKPDRSGDFDAGIEPGEEFTPEERIELARENSLRGQSTVSQPKKSKSSGVSITRPFLVVFFTLLTGYSIWYGREKFDVGYCGVGNPPHQVIPSEFHIPDWAEALIEPRCEPCPPHAYCYERLETVCEPDFVLKPHPLSLGGLVPLPPTCEPDGEKVRRIKAVADRAVEELRERRAKWECGDLIKEDGTPAKAVEIDADELKKEIGTKKRKGMTESEFEELWVGAIGEITTRPEVQTMTDGPPGAPSSKRLSSTSLAHIPLICAIRRSFRLAVARYRVELATIALVLTLFFYGRYRYSAYTATIAAVPPLVRMTLDRLATQAALHVQNREAFPEPWISMSQLRDDVLRHEHSISKREAIWSRVRKVVEMNANIRASQREGRSGEISRVWEWIGAIASGDGAEDQERRRKSGRVSWGVQGDTNSPAGRTDDGPVQQKWTDSRPIY